MDLSLYKPTALESWISKKYKDNGIHYASDLLDLDRVAAIFNAVIGTIAEPNARVFYDGEDALMLLSAFAIEEQRRVQFFHELCHVLLHDGNQNRMPTLFMELQEQQAEASQLRIAMPAFLLDEFKHIRHKGMYIKILSEEFKLPISFVTRRVEQIQRQLLRIGLEEEAVKLAESQWRKYDPSKWTSETRRIMDQLYQQLETKGAI